MYYENVIEYLVCSFFIVSKATFSVKESQIFGAYSKGPVWCQSSHGQGQQCKWLSTMDLENGVFLRTIQYRSSYCSWLSCLYPPFQCFVCIGLILWEARAEVHAASCWDAAQSNQSWALTSTVPVHTLTFLPPSHISLISRLLPHFQDLSSSQDLQLLSHHPFSLQNHVLFSGATVFQHQLTLSETLDCSPFPSSLSLSMIKWMMLSWYLYWIQSMQSLFAHGIIKLYNKATQ